MKRIRLDMYVRMMMYSRWTIAILAANLLAGPASASDAFRKPFDLHLEVDQAHDYEEHFEHMPYVAESDVYLFNGDEFGVTLSEATAAVAREARHSPG